MLKKIAKIRRKNMKYNAPLFSSSFFGPHLTSINPSYPLGVELRLTGKEKWGNHTWYLSKKWGWKERSIIVCIELFYSSWGEDRYISFSDFGNFFQHVKKLLNFWNFVNIKMAKSKLNHLGFYCKLDFLIGKS